MVCDHESNFSIAKLWVHKNKHLFLDIWNIGSIDQIDLEHI